MDKKDNVRSDLRRMKEELRALSSHKVHVGVIPEKAKGSSEKNPISDEGFLAYARAQEYGAVIRPGEGKENLAIPIDRKAKGKSPRDFKNLFFIKSKNGYTFGVTKGKNGSFNFLFLLLPSTVIPERSYIRASYDKNLNIIAKECETVIDSMIKGDLATEDALNSIGERGMGLILDYMMKDVSPPKGSIASATSGSDRTLYDSGRLYKSIGYKVTEEDK